MQIVTWNVNSLRVRLPQLLDWLAANRPDMTPPSGDAAWLAGMVSSIVEGVASGLARGEDPARRALALRQLLQPEGVLAALVEFRSRRDPEAALCQPLKDHLSDRLRALADGSRPGPASPAGRAQAR